MTADIANEFQWKKGSKGTSRSFTIMQSKYRRWHLLYRITLSKIEMAKISLFTAVAFHHNSAISDCDCFNNKIM